VNPSIEVLMMTTLLHEPLNSIDDIVELVTKTIIPAHDKGTLNCGSCARLHALHGGKLSLLLQDDALDNPNGLLVEDERLVVASWGKMAPDFSTKVPGHMKAVDLATKKVSALGDSTPVGNFDGVEPDGKGGYLVTDWVSGGLFHGSPSFSTAPATPPLAAARLV
jgi:hypothetical protein